MIKTNKINEAEEVVAPMGISATNNYKNPKFAPIEQPAKDVMTAYQNANKWLDSIKETILIDFGCPFFSNEIHKLAHTMPGRFDKFGDILHERHLLINYPRTEEISKYPADMNEAFQQIFDILDSINDALMGFIDVTKDTSLHFMALEAENLMTDVNKDYTDLGTVYKMLEVNDNLASFDRWVQKYYSEKSNLL